MNLEKIFSKLVSFPTISESSNELLIDYIIKYLKDYNLEAIKIEGHKNRFNLYCKIGPNTHGGIILSGQIYEIQEENIETSLQQYMKILNDFSHSIYFEPVRYHVRKIQKNEIQ